MTRHFERVDREGSRPMNTFFDDRPKWKWLFFTIGVVGTVLIIAGFATGVFGTEAIAPIVVAGLLVFAALWYGIRSEQRQP